MRPLQLTISAFGPYADRLILNLEDLGESGLYLITGRTGSGKTTIFDAISYALYGEPSGAGRQPQMMRSKYAPADIPTEVSLTFRYAERDYTITRNPEYERPAKRGKGMTKQAAGVELRLPDGTVITKTKEVSERITEILGVDRERFSQVAMIAQGDFMKLLTADTAARQAIFRKIFHTDRFALLQEELKKEAQKIEKDYAGARRVFEEYAGMISCGAGSAFVREMEALKEGRLPDPDLVRLAENILKEDRSLQKDLEAAEASRSEQLAQVGRQIAHGEQREKVRETLAQLQKQLQPALEQRAACDAALAGLQAEEPERIRLQELAAVEKEQLVKYEQLEQKKAEVTKAAAQLEKKKEEEDSRAAALASLGKELDAAEVEQKSLSDAPELHAAAQNRFRDVEDKLRLTEELLGLPDAWRKLEQEARSTQEEYLRLSQQYEEADARHRHLQKAFLDAQAGILAATLQEGVPCPVCGSLHHPHPAQAADEEVNEAGVEKAQKERDALGKKMQKKSSEAGVRRGKEEEKRKQLTEKLAEYAEDEAGGAGSGRDEAGGAGSGRDDVGGPDGGREAGAVDIDDFSGWLTRAEEKLLAAYDGFAADKTKASQEIQTQKRRLERLKTLQEKETPKLRQRLEQDRGSLASLQEERSALKVLLREREGQVAQMRKDLSYADRAEARAHLDLLEKQAQAMTQALAKAQKEAKEQEVVIERIKGSMAGQEEILRGTDEVDLEAVKEDQARLMQQRTEAGARMRELGGRIRQNETAFDRLSESLGKMQELQNLQETVANLSMAANGTVPGREKIMLETYVQMRYFDRIIERANARFMIMSGGQFELRRQTEVSDLRSQSGLDLCILDHHSGSTRSVKTLSGGESFMAALSMALGLSDEIQAQSGGIRLDTMFVDEGFGTLDEESLELAMRALASLAGGHRLIGIISHVDTLKSRIEKRIEAVKGPDGKSSARIVLP